MPKYSDEIKEQCVSAVKGINSGAFVTAEVEGNEQELKTLADIRRAYGPNPKAIARYCKKAGVPMPRRRSVKPKKGKK